MLNEPISPVAETPPSVKTVSSDTGELSGGYVMHIYGQSPVNWADVGEEVEKH